MNGEKVTFQVNFWALVGPLICLLTLFVFYIKNTPSPLALPSVLVCGLPVCWKWKLKGFAGAALLVFAILVYYYSEFPLEERFWHLGMGCSILLSLLITALSFEELEALVEAMKLESRSRLENLWKVDEKLQQANAELKKKKERIREGNIKLTSYQKLLDRSSEELVELRAAEQKLIQEHQDALKEIQQWQEKWNSLQESNRASPAVDDSLIRLAESHRLLEEAKQELEDTQEQLLQAQKEIEEMKMYQLSDVEEALQRHLMRMEKEREEKDAEHQKEIDSMQEMIANLLKSAPKFSYD